MFDPQTQTNIDSWLNNAYDEETKDAVRLLIKTNPQEALNAFYTRLSFGTGGLRGIVGVGSNRMNRYTVMTATQGLANYILKHLPPAQQKVLIGYDSRIHSAAFAFETAQVLAANGIHVQLFRHLRPTPLISYGVRKLQCGAGVVITASHNPPSYNGYKVYWTDGGQLAPPQDQEIMAEINGLNDLSRIQQGPLESPLITWIDTELDTDYLNDMDSLQGYPKDNHEQGKQLKIVYTPLHGAGITLVPKILERWGFSNIHLVPTQAAPDGHFPTVEQPNPEERAALKHGIDLLTLVNGDILLATDPDADRMGIVVMHRGKPERMDGNQIASLCLEHVARSLSKQGRLPPRAACIKTFVTTEMLRTIAQAFGIACIDVPTGFKWIAATIHQWETEAEGMNFLFGGEESFGYLLGTMVRDKDAVISCALICEVALHAKLQGKTLVDLLHDLYRKYGIYREQLLSVKYPETKEGREQMAQAIAKLKTTPPKRLGKAIILTTDYPAPDMIRFRLDSGGWVVVRPSGTEPKVKVYGGASQAVFSFIEDGIRTCEEKVHTMLEAIIHLLTH